MKTHSRQKKCVFTGWFAFRLLMLKWFGKFYAKCLVKNLCVFKKQVEDDHNRIDYAYARYILRLAEDDDFRDDCIREIVKWIIENRQQGLLPTLSDIYTCNKTVYIYTLRPGLWIGKGGSNIDSLVVYLRKTWPDVVVELVENTDTLSKVYSYYTMYNDYAE